MTTLQVGNQPRAPTTQSTHPWHALVQWASCADHLGSATSSWLHLLNFGARVVREPWSSFLPSTVDGALLGRDGHVWPCLSGSSHQWLLPTLVHGGYICGAERCAGRRALPPLDIKCSTEWHSLPGGTRWTLLMPLLKASPPMATTGGPAVDPAHRATLQLQTKSALVSATGRRLLVSQATGFRLPRGRCGAQ